MAVSGEPVGQCVVSGIVRSTTPPWSLMYLNVTLPDETVDNVPVSGNRCVAYGRSMSMLPAAALRPFTVTEAFTVLTWKGLSFFA